MTALPGKPAIQPAEGLPTRSEAVVMSSARQKAQERHSEAYWRRWAIRLLSLWVLLSLLLVSLRVQTSDIRSTLLDTQEASQLLVVERDGLSMEVQTLQSASRITAWAEEQDMLRFADSLKRSAEISGVSLPQPAQTPPAQLEVRTEWRSPSSPTTGEEPRGN